MEPVSTLAFAITLSAINLSPMPIDECVAWRTEQPEQRLCVEVEPPCGKSLGMECLGRADLDKPKAKKFSTKRVYYRKNGRLLYRTVNR